MSEESPKVSNPTPQVYKHVDVDSPVIIDAIRNCKKNGVSKEKARELIGMPMEVIDRHYKD